jgi:L-ribulose-5-phosphate 3-epimerase
MKISRRTFLRYSAAGTAGLVLARYGLDRIVFAEESGRYRLGACDWSLQKAEPAALNLAKVIGLDGVEVSAGEPADTLRIADPAYRQAYREKMAETGVTVASVAMGFLNQAPLASDPRGPAWLEQTIDAAADLDTEVILLAFFGKGDLRKKDVLKKDCIDTVVERLKDAAPRAKEKGVILGLENTLSGKDNLDILSRVKSDAVRIYYDIGNSTYNGYDVPAEIRDLGDRICQIHFKDGGYFLGDGKVAMAPVVKAIDETGYKGWIILETAVRGKDVEASFRKNAEYVRKVMSFS